MVGYGIEGLFFFGGRESLQQRFMRTTAESALGSQTLTMGGAPMQGPGRLGTHAPGSRGSRNPTRGTRAAPGKV